MEIGVQVGGYAYQDARDDDTEARPTNSSVRQGGRTLGLVFSVIAIIGGCPLSAQEVAIPVEVHVPLLMKILHYDRNLPGRLHGDIPLGVLYQGKYRTSATVASEVREAIAQLPADVLSGYQVRIVGIDLDNTENIRGEIARHGLRLLYLTPMRAIKLDSLLQASREAQVLTLTGVPHYVETGVAIGIDRRGERTQIVVNMAASRAEGADLSAQLLKLARVIKQKEK